MRAGKDIYCEKPLTLTIDEGKKLGQVAKETKRVVQVGTQQRSDHNRVFLLAVAMVRAGRIGKVRKVTAAIGGGPTGGPFPVTEPPPELNWDMWLGQAPKVAYREHRCHSDFRWWYEYSGGKLTDWGAHHVDIGQWGIGMENSGPDHASRSSRASCRSSSRAATRPSTTDTTRPPSSSSAPRFANGVHWRSATTPRTA